MGPGDLHVLAAGLSLPLGAAVLLRAKGTRAHVNLGRLYLLAMLLVSLPALLVYDITGRPGIFHLLAVVSLVTLALGWLSAPSRRSSMRSDVRVHATFMAWSFIGLVTAGLAQVAGSLWSQWTPWPVIVVVAACTTAGLVGLPRVLPAAVAPHQHRPRPTPG